MKAFLLKIDEALAGLEKILVAFILSFMIFFSFGQVVLRNWFNEGILWVDVVLRQMVLWVGFLGASLAVRDGRHICIELLPILLPASWRSAQKRTVNLAAGVISAFLARAAWRFMEFEREAESVLVSSLPVWIFQIILPIGLGVIALRFLLRAAVNPPPHPEEGGEASAAGGRA